ncbi:hypothetical protein OGAPHI_001426 [Ogataea philodendri]|uniref:BHLH domain-containing protein n=1 Tax=Ogataea philodendri TaxID=1378263 RepID=A0A9P8T8K6_9ASCO|nr:uncharacterized protein OGAPHI_001426 [Ogataea philodendri]KAH3669305.1 hypothetical protein OGAPHI_001426 [Ogataea philodendri]
MTGNFGYNFDETEAFLMSLNSENPDTPISDPSSASPAQNEVANVANYNFQDNIADWLDTGDLDTEQTKTLFSSPESAISHSDSSHAPRVSPIINSNGSKVKKDRSSHNVVEKKYRMNINTKILELRDAVPSLRAASGKNGAPVENLEGLVPADKVNKASILSKATEYIRHLESKNAALMNEIAMLRTSLDQQMAHQNYRQQDTPHFSQLNTPYMNQHPTPAHYTPNPSPHHNSNQSYVMGPQQHMPLGSKIMLGGMTAMVGTQFFDPQDTNYRGLSFLPLQQLFPILESPHAATALNVSRILLFFGGLFLILQPLYISLTAPKQKAVQLGQSELDLSLSEYNVVRLLASKLHITSVDLKEKLDTLKALNRFFAKWVTTTLENQSKTTYTLIWKPLFKFYFISFAIDDGIDEIIISDETIKFHFTRLVLTKMMITKVGGFFSSVLGLQRKADSLVLGLVKNLKQTKDISQFSKEAVTILKLINNDMEIFENEDVIERLIDILKWREVNNTRSNIAEFIQNSEDSELSLANLICVIRYDQLLQDYQTAAISVLADDPDNSDTELASIVEKIKTQLPLIPQTCVKLEKHTAILNGLLDPNSDNVKQTFDMVLASVKDLVEYTEAIYPTESDEQNESLVTDSTISKIYRFAQQPGRVSQLVEDEIRLCLTCTLILHYFEAGETSNACRLINYLNISGLSESVSLLTLIGLLRTVIAISEHVEELDDENTRNKQTVESLVGYLRLYVGTTTGGSQSGESTSSTSVSDGAGLDIQDLDFELRTSISHKLVCLGKQIGDTDL